MAYLTNFGKETREKLEEFDYDIYDISFIFFGKIKTTNTDRFFNLADRLNYDDGYGAQEINPEIVIYMNDGNRFERKENDGAEWWEFIKDDAPGVPFDNDFDINFFITGDFGI